MAKSKDRYVLDEHRVIAFLDVDSFSVQLVRKLRPELNGRPIATRRTIKAPIDSVSYEANNVYKGMTASEATEKCPNIEIITKSEIPGFNDIQRKASEDMFDVIIKFCGKDITIEKTSMDDLFLDLSDKCDQYMKDNFNYDKSFLQKLEVVVEGGVRQFSLTKNRSLQRTKWIEAAVVMSDLSDHIYHKTSLICSVGISFNKLLAKISCKINKPKTIAIIQSKPGIARIFKGLPLSYCDGLGSKTGSEVKNRLNISTLHEMRGFRRQKLISMFGRNGTGNGAFLWEVCRGIDNTPVRHKTDFSTQSFGRNYSRAIKCCDKRLFNDLYNKCEEMANRMNSDLKRNHRIAHRIRIEVFTKNGVIESTTTYLMCKYYVAKAIYDIVVAKQFPQINEKVPDYIRGFRLVALDFKPTSDAISGLVQQISEIKIN